MGYGTLEGLEAVQQALQSRQLRLQSAEGLRIGLLICDDQTLIFSPTPLLIEAGSTAPSKPSAILLQTNPADSLAGACGASDKPEAVEIGQDFVSDARIAKVKADLKENPAKQFNLARLERVFNYALQFVEFKVEGYQLGKKILPLDPEWVGLSDQEMKERFKSSFNLFDSNEPLAVELSKLDDEGNPVKSKTEKVSEKTFTAAAKELRKELIPLGSYGSVT